MTKKKIIHYLNPVLFTNVIINNFKDIYKNSDFYILTDGEIEKKFIELDNVFYVNIKNIDELNKHLNSVNNSNTGVVIFHYLDYIKKIISKSLSPNIKQCWCLWGHDLYSSNLNQSREYENITYNLFRNNDRINYIKNKISKVLIIPFLLFCAKHKLENKIIRRAFEKFNLDILIIGKNFDFISYIVPKEKDIIEKYFPNAEYIHLYSNPNSQSFQHFDKVIGNNILVGNSAAYSNNHLDSFEILKTLNLKNRKIIVPLSYSGSKKYIEQVVKKGNELFGDQFIPLLERLPLEKYSEILSSCSIAIMNQRRQQSGGNLVHLIGSGAKVFINPNNGFYDYFRSGDIEVFSTESIDQESIDDIKDLSLNREKLLKLYSQEHFEKEVFKLLSAATLI